MSKHIYDGGPAFPMQVRLANGTDNFSGMSLRDWFAGQALAGMLGNTDWSSASGQDLADFAFEASDAMLAARKEKK